MREKILEIISESDMSLNPIEIMDRIKSKSTATELRDLIIELDNLCKEGVIRMTSGNSYKMNELLTGVVDLHQNGSAHVRIEGMEDVFIPKHTKSIKKGKKNYNVSNSNNMISLVGNRDRVLVEITDEAKKEGKIVKIIERSLGKGLGEVVVNNGKVEVKPLDKNLPYNVVVDADGFNLVDGLLVNLKFVKDIDKKTALFKVDNIIAHKNAPDADFRQISAEFGIPLDFTSESLKEASLFPQELTEEMITKALENGRIDFRNDLVYTVDGKDTKDIDDAIARKTLPNGNNELAIHIADVSHFVKRNMALWADAEKKGNSTYLGDKVGPMFPVELSNGICSLNENVDRFSLSVVMEIDNSGKRVNQKLCLGIIKSRKKMNYDAVQDIIENKETEDTKDYTTLTRVIKDNETIDTVAFENNMTVEELYKYNENFDGKNVNVPVKNIIKDAFVLSKKLDEKRKIRGEIEFLSDEKKYIFDENGKVIDVLPRVQRHAEKIIQSFMIEANEAIGDICKEYNIPAVYRVHGVPTQKSMEDYIKFLHSLGLTYNGKLTIENVSNKEIQKLLEHFSDNPKYEVINKRMLRSMQKAYYDPVNIGHFGISSPRYIHFTSPIRRFADLLIHTILVEFVINKSKDESRMKEWLSYLTVICKYISDMERLSEKAEYEMDALLDAEYMEGYTDESGNKIGGHIGEEFDAIVDTCLPNAFFVQTNKKIEGRVSLDSFKNHYTYDHNLMAYTEGNKVKLRYGDKVRVKCIRASRESRQIDFTLVRKIA